MIEETQYLPLNKTIVDRVHQIARDQTPTNPTERPADEAEGQQAPPEPVDPPDNESLPGDPSTTYPDY